MANASGAQTFVFEGFQLDVARRKLTGPDGPIEVPSRAFDVLLYMVTHPGELLDKARLMQAVWPGTVVEEGNLSQCIFALRRAFGDTATEPRFIATVPGRGYQFVAQVRELPHDVATDEIATTRSRRPAYAVAVAIAIALLVAFRFWPASTTTGVVNSGPEPVPASIAVLPFADLSSTRDMEYFADGLAEELRNSLSKVRGLRLIGRHSSSAMGQSDDARSFGERLHVAAILEGSVRKEGDRIDIKVHLTRIRDGVILWSEMYDRHFDDVLDIQGSIAREVAATLAPAVRHWQESGQQATFDATLTRDAEAYRAYLRGVYLFTRWYDRDPQPARVEFLRAVERDPQFAKAYAMLARTYQLSAQLAIGDAAQEKALAAAAMGKALKLDPAIGDMWWVKMDFIAKEATSFTAQATDLERAVADNPTEIEPMIWLAHTYLTLGRPDEALELFERAYAADPISPNAIWNIAWYGYAYHGDRQRFLDLADEIERTLPHDPKPSWMRSNLAFNEGRALDWDRFVARVIEVDPGDHQNHAWLAFDYGSLGAFDAALYHAKMCAKLDPLAATCALSVARTELASGDIAAARSTLRDAISRDPRNSQIQLAQGELLYFSGDCAEALPLIAKGRPEYDQPEDRLDLYHYTDDVPIFTWCLRQQGETARVAAMSRVFNRQTAPPVTAGLLEGTRARMAAAVGDRNALAANLTALANARNPELTFPRHDPLIQAYLKDAEIVALLDKLDARRAELRRILPKASTRVPIPGITPANRGS
jgi:TolB-like protein/DNA-binding winged helix-turn-helix (wHTH) protein/Tfp pilus assembly protein PilF